jgi:membrane-associated phospholipid phosphatase
MNIITILRSCKWYFLGLLLLLLTGSFLLIGFGKSASFITLNSYHPFALNVFFVNYTFVGDGIFALALIVLLYIYFKQKQKANTLLISFLISGCAVQIIKNLVDSPRPHLFFEPGQYLYFIDGVTLANHHSFPSGHTTTAFAIATVLVMLSKNKSLQLLILLLAALVGYSRIYLAQHFLLDVIIGAALGTTSGVVAVYLNANAKNFKLSFGRLKQAKTNNTFPSPSTVQAA